MDPHWLRGYPKLSSHDIYPTHFTVDFLSDYAMMRSVLRSTEFSPSLPLVVKVISQSLGLLRSHHGEVPTFFPVRSTFVSARRITRSSAGKPIMEDYFSPVGFVSLPRVEGGYYAENLDNTLASIHAFIRKHPSRFLDKTYISFHRSVECFSGCMVIPMPSASGFAADSTSISTTTSASASGTQLKFNVVLIRLTNEKSVDHLSTEGDAAPTPAIKRFIDLESKPSSDGIQLRVLGTCYAHTHKNFSVQGTCEYPIDTVHLDVSGFRQKMGSYILDTDNTPMCLSQRLQQ